MTRPTAERAAIILGAADGIGLAISEILSLHAHPASIFNAGLGAAIAELVMMTAGLWLSSGEDRTGFLAALACGVATFLACLIPVIPFAIAPGNFAAGVTSGLLLGGLAAVVVWLRPQRGLLAFAETYGVLLVAGGLAWAASIFVHVH